MIFAEEVRNSVEDLLKVTNPMSLNQIKTVLDILTSNVIVSPWLIEEYHVSNYRKKLCLKTIQDLQMLKPELFETQISLEVITTTLKKITLDENISDEIAEEIYACLFCDFDAYTYEINTGLDYEHLHQIRLGLENGVNLYAEITNDTPITEVIKLRLDKQSGVFEAKIAEELRRKRESSEEEETIEDGESTTE